MVLPLTVDCTSCIELNGASYLAVLSDGDDHKCWEGEEVWGALDDGYVDDFQDHDNMNEDGDDDDAEYCQTKVLHKGGLFPM